MTPRYYQILKQKGAIFGNKTGNKNGIVGLDYVTELFNADLKQLRTISTN